MRRTHLIIPISAPNRSPEQARAFECLARRQELLAKYIDVLCDCFEKHPSDALADRIERLLEKRHDP